MPACEIRREPHPRRNLIFTQLSRDASRLSIPPVPRRA